MVTGNRAEFKEILRAEPVAQLQFAQTITPFKILL
jgi:hypothetical protein